ncbi:MAG: DUF6788 family protein [Syntrophobacteraceae bacterium]
MDMLHKKRAESGRMSLDDPHRLGPYAVDLDHDESAEDADGIEQIPVGPGREIMEAGRRGARCYRLEKTRCGKKGCRCARGELHGPYWYAYYRENGRMRCEYLGKSLPEHVSLENRARKARKSAGAECGRAARIVAEVKDTLKKLARFDGIS